MTLKELLLRNKPKLVLYAIGVFLSAIVNIVLTYGMGYAFNVLEVDSLGGMLRILIISMGLMLLPTLLQLTSRFLRIGYMADTLKEVRSLAYQKIMNQDYEAFSSRDIESYQSQLISDVNLFERDFFLSVLNLGFMLISASISFLLLLQYSVTIACISLGTSIILYLISRFYEAKVRAAQEKTVRQNKVFNNVLGNLVSGFRTVKSYSKELLFQDRFNHEIESLESVKADFFKLNKNQELLSHTVSTVASVSNYFIISLLLLQNKIGVGDIIVVLNLASSLLWGMIGGVSFINRLKSSVDIYYDLVDLKPSTQDGVLITSTDMDYNLKDLAFSYGDKKILEGLDLEIKAGDKVLIHGPSGTGKTTLLNVLSQHLKGYEGNVSFAGSEIKDLDHRSFFENSAYIRQSHFMFNDSIKNNIIMNRPYDETLYQQVIEKAALKEWHDTVGSDYQLKENGSNISGGQRQRVSIARELYSDYGVIFIDEPSASLDDDNAQIIYDTIIGLEQTVICVSHRHLDYLKEHFDHVISFEGDKHAEI